MPWWTGWPGWCCRACVVLPRLPSSTRGSGEVLRQLWGGADLGLGELAGACGVSPSRLTHLFRQETGTSLRQYRSWVRLRSALDVLWSGLSLTDLAHGAGFADCAHFSRTIVQMLGSTPSDLRRSMVAVGAR